jgi:hypothetical protein
MSTNDGSGNPLDPINRLDAMRALAWAPPSLPLFGDGVARSGWDKFPIAQSPAAGEHGAADSAGADGAPSSWDSFPLAASFPSSEESGGTIGERGFSAPLPSADDRSSAVLPTRGPFNQAGPSAPLRRPRPTPAVPLPRPRPVPWWPATVQRADNSVDERWPAELPAKPAWPRTIASAPLTLPAFPSKLKTPTLDDAGLDPADIAGRMTQAESSGNPNASAKTSTAQGLGQITNDTWFDLLRKHRPELGFGRNREDILALKFDPDLNRQMTLAYAEDNAKGLKNANLPITPARLYLMHFLGPGDAPKVLRADPDTPAASIVSSKSLNSNGNMILGRTAAQMLEWASRKMGVPPEPWSYP